MDHLSDTDLVAVIPYDKAAPFKFKNLEKKIKARLGEVDVFHRGASSLGISGQGELDVYLPVSEEVFDKYLTLLTALFGEPGTVYPLERARFVTEEEGTKVEVFLISENSEGWLNGIRFEKYLKEHPKYLEEYRIIKEKAAGLSTREYYRKKIEFINEILVKSE